MLRRWSSIFALLLASCQPPPASNPRCQVGEAEAEVAIEEVTVVDGDGALPRRTVLLGDGKILAIHEGCGPSSAPSRIDGRGRYLTPSLVDSHVHLGLAATLRWIGDPLHANLRASLAHGITVVVDLGGPASLLALSAASREGRLLGPRVLASGSFLTAAGAHPCEQFPYAQCRFISEATAEAAGRELVDRGADLLKAVLADTGFMPWPPSPRLDPGALASLAGLRRPLAVHVDSPRDAVEAVAAGATLLAHPPFSHPISSEAGIALASARAVHSTLGAFAAPSELVDGKLRFDAEALPLGAAALAEFDRVRRGEGLPKGFIEETRRWAETARENLLRARAAGARLLPGSDAGYLLVPHGLGLHLELRRLEAAGLPPLALLAASTRDARALFELPGGSVRAGSPADLLLLRADPAASVQALGQIDLVFLRGKSYTPTTLRALDLLTGLSDREEPCLEHSHCIAGLACDGLAHVCRRACSPYAAINDCGVEAWCMPAGALAVDSEGVCRPEQTCDPYQSEACGREFPGYRLGCTPLDRDTSACRLAGEAGEGEACEFLDEGSTCAPGLYCSPFDQSCYRICDPAASSPGCQAPRVCRMQFANLKLPWFGLCIR